MCQWVEIRSKMNYMQNAKYNDYCGSFQRLTCVKGVTGVCINLNNRAGLWVKLFLNFSLVSLSASTLLMHHKSNLVVYFHLP